MTPSAATPIQSRPRGQRLRSASATGSRKRKPSPKRNTEMVTGSAAWMMKRVTAAAIPPRALEMTPARMPNDASLRAGL